VLAQINTGQFFIFLKAFYHPDSSKIGVCSHYSQWLLYVNFKKCQANFKRLQNHFGKLAFIEFGLYTVFQFDHFATDDYLPWVVRLGC
jgi:hypothetical protein